MNAAESTPQAEALQGTFRNFPLSDLLGLVSQQKRTGVLHLSANDEQAIDVTFRKGLIIKAKKARPKARELFGNLLVEANLITDAQRSRAVDEQRRTLKQLGEILVDQGALSREELRTFINLQSQETLYQPFEWSDGAWKFTEVEQGDDFESMPPLDCETVVKEGLRRQAAWPALRRRFPSHTVAFKRVKPLPVPGSPSLVKAQKKGLVLGAKERRVYALAEPGVPLSSIIALSRIGEFETLSSASHLYDGGIRKVIVTAGDEVGDGRSLWSRLQGQAKNAALVILAMAMAAASVFLFQWRAAEADTGLAERSTAQREILEQAQHKRLSIAIEAYRQGHGTLPESLETLVDAGLLTPRDMSYPFRSHYVYRPQKDGTYLLLPPVR